MKYLLIMISFLFLTGCHNFDSSVQPTELTDKPLVIFIYGLAAPADGNGLLEIQQRIKGARPDWNVTRMYWDDNYANINGTLFTLYQGQGSLIKLRKNQKIILIGHSYGGDKAISLCREYDNIGIKVDLLIVADPVPLHMGFLNFVDYYLPDNIDYALCVYRRAIIPPYSCPIRNGKNYKNVRIGFPGGHEWIISKRPEIRQMIIDEVLKIQ